MVPFNHHGQLARLEHGRRREEVLAADIAAGQLAAGATQLAAEVWGLAKRAAKAGALWRRLAAFHGHANDMSNRAAFAPEARVE